MISYHLQPFSNATGAWPYRLGWRSTECVDPHRLARCMLGYVWSPCIWAGGRREQSAFVSSAWCVLDFDDGRLSLHKAIALFHEFTHVIGTTKSHQLAKGGKAPCDRFRVALLWEREIRNLEEYRFNVKIIQEKYGADGACIDGARLFYPCQMIMSAHDGDYLAVREQKHEYSLPENEKSRREFPGLTLRALRFLAYGAPTKIGLNGATRKERNVEAFYFANRAFEKGWTARDIFDAIKSAESELGDSEVKHIVESAQKTNKF